MTETRKKLKVEDQEQIIKIVLHYQDLHKQISEMELQMEELEQRKDFLLSDLKNSRLDEQFLMSKMSFSYGGDGKIDTHTMEWVLTEDKVCEEHETTETNKNEDK